MLLSGIPHHITGDFSSHRKFLADKEYGEALDTLVKACSDMLLMSPDSSKIFIGKRKVQPQPDWWFVGGRIFPGETPAQSCCRLLRRELKLEIDPARLQPVCCQSLAWGMREQAPKENGTTDSQFVLSLQYAPNPAFHRRCRRLLPSALIAAHCSLTGSMSRKWQMWSSTRRNMRRHNGWPRRKSSTATSTPRSNLLCARFSRVVNGPSCKRRRLQSVPLATTLR